MGGFNWQSGLQSVMCDYSDSSLKSDCCHVTEKMERSPAVNIRFAEQISHAVRILVQYFLHANVTVASLVGPFRGTTL